MHRPQHYINLRCWVFSLYFIGHLVPFPFSSILFTVYGHMRASWNANLNVCDSDFVYVLVLRIVILITSQFVRSEHTSWHHNLNKFGRDILTFIFFSLSVVCAATSKTTFSICVIPLQKFWLDDFCFIFLDRNWPFFSWNFWLVFVRRWFLIFVLFMFGWIVFSEMTNFVIWTVILLFHAVYIVKGILMSIDWTNNLNRVSNIQLDIQFNIILRFVQWVNKYDIKSIWYLPDQWHFLSRRDKNYYKNNISLIFFYTANNFAHLGISNGNNIRLSYTDRRY